MIKVYNSVDQRTKEWFELKWGKIGGTRSSGLYVKSDTLMIEMLSELTEDFQLEQGYQSLSMLRGQELEPLARAELSKYTGVEFLDVAWIQNLTKPLIGISPDGLDATETIACELKCVEGKKYIEILLNDEIPKDHIHQCIHYFTANPKLQTLYYCCFRPENKIKKMFVKKLDRDTLVDAGLTVKGKIKEDRGLGVKEYVCVNPDMRTIEEWVEHSYSELENLEQKIESAIKQLNF